ncbi:ZC3H12C [Cordylochernes scorpioides]|uniref:ZC3H12C n=1 Tax=Cordylochernes scorpioides TaxID=51811 RepID=A0ABY6LS63_9ARAC|nr:ZC3H12C [Cordylochernes scorpioides]
MVIKNVRKWCWEFNEGRINVHDEQRSGRLSLPESTVAQIDEMVRANRRITLEEIEDGLNEDCSHFSVHKIVSETLGYRRVSARWVDKWLKEAAGEWYNTGITNHGNNGVFSCRGIKLVIDYFRNRGHSSITAFVPQYMRKRNPGIPISDQQLLEQLHSEGFIEFTPSRTIGSTKIASYDDRFIVGLASKNGGVIVSNDNFRDIICESPEFARAKLRFGAKMTSFHAWRAALRRLPDAVIAAFRSTRGGPIWKAFGSFRGYLNVEKQHLETPGAFCEFFLHLGTFLIQQSLQFSVLELLGRFSMWFIIKFEIATLEFFKPPVTLRFAQSVVAVNFLEHSVGFSGTFLPVEGEQQNFPQMGTFWLRNRHFPRAPENFHDLNFSKTARMLMPRESKNKTPTTAPPSAQIKLHSGLWRPFSRFILIDLRFWLSPTSVPSVGDTCAVCRLLMYCMVGDFFMPPEDPLGRRGPKLEAFLRFP